MEDKFYLQDSRSYVGNDVLWWAKDGDGYTTDLSKAHVYTKDEAQHLHNMRETDLPWPKSYIDARVRPAVDMQYIKRPEAAKLCDIVIKEPNTRKRRDYTCGGCCRFMSVSDFYSGPCTHCNTDNRP